MPRRRRGLDRMMVQRRAQRDAAEIGANDFLSLKPLYVDDFTSCVSLYAVALFLENIAAEVEEDNENESPQDEERPQATGKVGAKKQRKLEEKQARRAQREVG